ncbi:MAG TPA: hypothetical protein V6C65_38840 [Allocoleopsis sp.]
MKDLKAKLSAIDDLIGRCEEAIARPGKQKRMALIVKEEPKEEREEDMLDKKAKLSSMLDEMDEEELLKLYEQLED